MTYKIPVILIFTAVYIYRLMISVLTLKSEKNPIPANVSDVYDKETYEKWKKYHEETVRFGIISDNAAFIGFRIQKTTCYAGVFPVSFSFKIKTS